MKTSRPREIACAVLIDTQGRFLFQQRDDVPGIVHPGKIGLFGGHREAGETFLQCVVREIHEEISYYVPPAEFEHLTRYNGLVEVDAEQVRVQGELFIAYNVPADLLKITEGSLLIVEADRVATVEQKFAPSALFAMEAFLPKQRTPQR